MERDSSWMAAVICSIDIVEDGAAAEADGSSCAAVMIDGGDGGLVEVERGPDISDTRLLCGCWDLRGRELRERRQQAATVPEVLQ